MLNSGAHRADLPGGRGALGSEPPTLAADLFLIMLDDLSGKLRVHPRAAGYALAGALLVELWMKNRITLDKFQVIVKPDQALPENDLLRRTLGWLLTEPEQVGVTSWVEAMSAPALDHVADQVERAGWIRRVERRRPGAGPLYESVDRNRVFWRTGRLTSALTGEWEWPDAFLFVLVDAAGFTTGLFRNTASPPSRDHLVGVFESVRDKYPSVVELVSVVRNLVDRVAVAPR